jgi:type IV secretion system protein VirB11
LQTAVKQGESALSNETSEQLKRLEIKLKRELGPVIVGAVEDRKVLDICVNSDGRIWIETLVERLYDTGERISSENLTAALGTMAAMNGMEINASHPVLECGLPLDGSRVMATVPPVSPDGPFMSVRKHSPVILSLSEYVEEGRITVEAAEYLRGAVRDEKNILVAGGARSGKTTFVNALIRELPKLDRDDRLILIEDTAEIKCATTNKQGFVSVGEVTMQAVLRIAMRSRPDRIIIGEVRGKEALDLLKGWNTGHPGGFATVHANDARAALLRLENLVMEESKNPMIAVIAEAINVIVFMEEFGRIGKQVTEIIEVKGYRGGEYIYETIYDLRSGQRKRQRRRRRRGENAA